MTAADHDIGRLRRALALARKGSFAVEPNPPVGCVIEAPARGIVGEGWHAGYGGPHAEIQALAAAGALARGATAYVSLAPCGRQGKTPPCCEALIEAGIARVVYAAVDPDPKEAEAGVRRLREAGVLVEGPLPELAADAESLLTRFRHALASERPWTACKWAMSLDGRIAPRRGAGGAVSGRRARVLAHTWRGHADAVAVGLGTVLADDPLLDCRLADGPPAGRDQPIRVVFDAELATPTTCRLVRDASRSPVWLVASEAADRARRAALEAAGCRVLGVPVRDGARDLVDLRAALRRLRDEGVSRLLVEGGARIHGALFRAGLVDQVSVFVAPRILGGDEAVPAVVGCGFPGAQGPPLEQVVWRRIGDDLLLQGYVPAAASA